MVSLALSNYTFLSSMYCFIEDNKFLYIECIQYFPFFLRQNTASPPCVPGLAEAKPLITKNDSTKMSM
jgi:hypothetical protein